MQGIMLNSEQHTTPSNGDQSQDPQQSQCQNPNLNTINLRTNEVYGDALQFPMPTSTSRFVSLNINGFRQAHDFQDALKTAQALKVTSAGVWNFHETNVNWRSSCLAKCFEKFRKVFHHTRLSTSSSIVTYQTLYQPGGMMSVVTNNYVGRVRETGSNSKMGGLSFVCLMGKHGRNIVIVCNQNANTVIDRMAFIQQLSLLRRNQKDCSPRKSFLDHLDKQLEEWSNKGYKILLLGDINKELGADVDGFARLSAGWNLVEIIQHFHGMNNEPPTYA
jgi:exonuclease III